MSGGGQPRWRKDGKEIFFASAPVDAKLVAATVDGSGSAFQIGELKPLFDLKARPNQGQPVSAFDASPDGQRFLVNRIIADAPVTPSITLVIDWPALLKK